MSELAWTFEMLCRGLGLEFEKEHRFHPTRRWRFDYADVENKIAIEIEGGIWVRGRHNRAKGFRNDTIKYNQATVLGWRVLRYCSEEDIVKYFEKDYNKILKNGS